MKILLVEDDDSIVSALTYRLAAHHYIVDAVIDGEAGWTYATTFEYDLIVLDVCLPKLDGISFCERFRAEGYTAPILFLTSQSNSLDKVRGLDAGADDYVVKPFDIAELSARIRALLRRGSASPFPLLVWGDLVLNPSTCEVIYGDRPLTLTTKEYDLLELFLRDCQYVFGADEILDRLWSSEEFPVEATVRSHIRRLRQKLSAAGAPHDFITTVHGRGYYLKPNAQEFPAPINPALAKRHYPPEQEQAYLAFLNEIWMTTQPESLQQLSVLSQAVKLLKTGSLDPSHQAQAQQAAHKLAGTLGIFMLTEGTRLAREIETLLQKPCQLNPIPPIEELLTTLIQLVQTTTSIEACQTPTQDSPLLLIFAQDQEWTQALSTAATCAGMRTAIASTLESARAWLLKPGRVQQPDAILLKLPSDQPQLGSNQLLPPATAHSLLQDLAHHYPSLPILVMGTHRELSDRLEVVRRGGKILLEASMTPEEVIAAVRQCLSGTKDPKVMVVDDDQTLLRTLPTLLNPWGFQVSTLAEPQQFWTVLEAVNPDALVLDVRMPQMNGLELCQILRSDLRWRQLPILFLSVVTDAQTQQQAFEAGADDYLCKPLAGADLAHRILNRLQRGKVW